jgi:hypothetical protein
MSLDVRDVKKHKREISRSTVMAGDFATLLSIGNRASRQKTSKDIEDLSNTICPCNLIDT